jgi:hypothetical protein
MKRRMLGDVPASWFQILSRDTSVDEHGMLFASGLCLTVSQLPKYLILSK